MSQSTDIAEWMDEINTGLTFRKEEGMEKDWSRLSKLYFNRDKSQKFYPAPNLIMSVGDSVLSSLMVPYPDVKVSPRAIESVDRAPVLERVLNSLLADMKVPEEVEDMGLNAFIYGTGFLKIGYDSEWGYDADRHDAGKVYKVDSLGKTYTQLDNKGRRIEFNGIRSGMPWVASVRPQDIVLPWGVRKLEQARWIAHRVVRHIDDLRSDPKYTNTRGLNPSISMQDYIKSYESPNVAYRIGPMIKSVGTGSCEYVEMWEIHDRVDNTVKVCVADYPKWIRNEPNMLAFGGRLPFISLNLTHRSYIWTTSAAYYLLQAQLELADITTVDCKSRRASALRFLYDALGVDPESIAKIESGQVGTFIGVNSKNGKPLQESIFPFQGSYYNQGFAMEKEGVRRDARETVGLGRNQLGEFEASGRRTATEADNVQQNSMLRMSAKHIGLSRVYLNLCEILAPVLFKYWNSPRVISYVGETGATEWETVTGSSIEGLYGYDITFGSKPVVTDDSDKQLALMLMQTFMQNPMVDQNELLRYVIRTFRDPRITKMFKIQMITSGANNANLPVEVPQSGVQGGEGGGSPQPSSGQGQPSIMPSVSQTNV